MPSMPASSAAFRRTRRVSRLPFMVSFSMQLMKMAPSPFLASIVLPTWLSVASANWAKSNWTDDLSILKKLDLKV